MKNEAPKNRENSNIFDKCRLLNFLSPNIIFIGRHRKIACKMPECSGIAYVSSKTIYSSKYQSDLITKLTGTDVDCKIMNDDKIMVYHYYDNSNDHSFELPKPRKNTYLLVSRDVARAACRIGRPTWDLIFPAKNGYKFHNSAIYIFNLEMME